MIPVSCALPNIVPYCAFTSLFQSFEFRQGGGDSLFGRLASRIRSKTLEPAGEPMYQSNPVQPQGGSQHWGRGRWSEPQGVGLSRGPPQQWGDQAYVSDLIHSTI